MIKTSILVTFLSLSQFVAAATYGANETLSQAWSLTKDSDKAALVATSKSSLSVLHQQESDLGMTRVRATYDMGQSGVQQIDYVINCSNGMMALADFAVITTTGRNPVTAANSSIENLSFYKPLIEHDTKLSSNACQSSVAMNN